MTALQKRPDSGVTEMTAFDKAWLLLKSDWDDLHSMYSNTHPIDTIDGLIDDFGDGDDEEIPYGGFGPNGETARWFDDIMGNVSQGHTWYDDEHGGHFNSPERWRHYNAKVAEGNLTYGPERWRHYNAIVPHSDDYDGHEPKQALNTVHHGTDKHFNSNSTDEEKIRHGLDLFPLMMGEDGRFYEEAPDWRASDNIAQWAVGDQWHNSVYGLKTIEKHFPDMKRDDIQRILREHAKGSDQYGNAYPDYSQQPHEEDWWYGDDDYNDEPIATGEPMDITFQLLKDSAKARDGSPYAFPKRDDPNYNPHQSSDYSSLHHTQDFPMVPKQVNPYATRMKPRYGDYLKRQAALSDYTPRMDPITDGRMNPMSKVNPMVPKHFQPPPLPQQNPHPLPENPQQFQPPSLPPKEPPWSPPNNPMGGATTAGAMPRAPPPPHPVSAPPPNMDPLWTPEARKELGGY